MNLLFVCTANINRSVTAAELFASCDGINTRSAGTHALKETTQLSQELLTWADKVFVMDEKRDGHASFIAGHFSLGATELYNLDIPDIYPRNDKELKLLLIKGVAEHVKLEPCLDRLLEGVRGSNAAHDT